MNRLETHTKIYAYTCAHSQEDIYIYVNIHKQTNRRKPEYKFIKKNIQEHRHIQPHTARIHAKVNKEILKNYPDVK